MHTHPQHTLDRLDRVLRDRIAPAVHAKIAPVTVASWEVDGDGEPVPASHALGLAPLAHREPPRYEPFEVGSPWGPAWSTTWFRVEGVIPADAPEPVELTIDLGWEDHSVGGHGEAMAYRRDGHPLKAIHPRHGWLRLRGPGAVEGVVADDGSFTLFLEAAANPLLLGLPPFLVTTAGDKGTATPADFAPYVLRSAELSTLRTEVWDLVRDLEVAGGLVRELPDDQPRYWRMLESIGAALDAYDSTDPSTAGAARAALAPAMSLPAHASAHDVSAVGHAHIDSAWLWPLRETRRKVARTVSNVLDLMRVDPDFRYAMSSAQQFAWLEEDQPELFAEVTQRVHEGRFIPVGGMWVESDAVMPTGESIVRQFLHGQRYFREKFGTEPDGVWLPDSFGYSGALPQLARRAGFRWFLTQKISWNDSTAFPHHSFSWQGIDGSRIFTHFPPSDTYAAEVSQAELAHAERTFRDKMRSSHSLLLFGYGDGGGGPTREMLGRLSRSSDLEGSPRLTVRDPSDFFAEADAEYTGAGGAPIWAGELYLELHRGTFTSQLAMKQGNRRSESMLRTVEHLSALAAIRAGAEFPRAELDEIWQTVLLHQFHDILPGSSIAWVHREARDTYADLDDRLRALAADALHALDATTPSAPAPRVSFAPTSSGRWTAEHPTAEGVVDVARTADSITLDNRRLRVVIGPEGDVRSLRDLERDREVVPEGAALGALQLFRDEPIRWDAWDVDRHLFGLEQTLGRPDSLDVREDEEGAAVVTVDRRYRSSRFSVTFRLAPGSDALEIDTDIDWHEHDHMLKLSLPVDVHTTKALFETQYGAVERSVGENTPGDEAQFEVSQHRYLHVAEPGYGIGIVNDSSYGCDVRRLESSGTGLRLSLLRAARFPDPGADIGPHQMRMAVVVGDLSRTIDTAYALNSPRLDLPTQVVPALELALTEGTAAIDWVTLADDGSGDVIVRIAELAGGRARGTLIPGPGLENATVIETDLLERPAVPAADLPRGLTTDGALSEADISLRPFQLTTLRIQHPAGSTSTKE